MAGLVGTLFFEVARHFFTLREAGGVLAAHRFFTHVGAVNAAQRFQHLHFFIADAIGSQIRRRRHGDHAQNLQQVVLDHVAHLPGLVEVAPAALNAHLFRHGDLNVIDGAAVPVIDEQGVGKAQRQQVQHRLFTQIVVDAVDLALFKELAYPIVDLAGGFQGSPQRFFHHHARRFRVQLRFAQTFANRAKGAWRHGEIVNGHPLFLIEHFAQAGKRFGIVDIKVTEIQTPAQGLPQTFIDFFLHEGFHRFTHYFGVSVFIPVGTADADDAGVRMDLTSFFELIQGRQQFTSRQVTLRAENDQIACLGRLRYRHVILLS